MHIPHPRNKLLLLLAFAACKFAESAYATERDYNAVSVCLFSGLVESYQLPRITRESIRNDPRFSKILQEDKEVISRATTPDLYKYKSDGAFGLVAENDEHAFFKEWTVSGSLLPIDVQTRDYLVPALQIQNPLAQANEIEMSCDMSIVTLKFNGSSLEQIHVENLVD